MKLIKRKTDNRKSKSSALKRARDRLAARHHAVVEPRPLEGETFIEHGECAKTGESFSVVWHRTDRSAKFTVREMIKSPNVKSRSNAPIAADARTYAISEFDYKGCACPYCGVHGGLVYCSCGKNPCHGGIYNGRDGLRSAIESCGCDVLVESVRTHNKGESDRSTPSAIEHESPAPRIKKSKNLLIGTE